MTKDEVRAALEERILNKEPFTYGSLLVWRQDHLDGVNGDPDRLIDSTLQRLRRQKKIDWQGRKWVVL